MRIAQLIETDGPGGAEQVVAQLTAALVRQGHEVTAFLPGGREGWLSREVERAGAGLLYFRLDQAVSPEFARWLREALQAQRIEVAHCHEWATAVYTSVAARGAPMRQVITMHGGRYYAERLRRRLALRWAAGRAAALVAVSETLRGHLAHDLHLNRERIRLVYNGLAPRAGAAGGVRASLGLQDTDLLLLAVGNLYPVKGHTHLLGAIARLGTSRPGLHVAIAGRGELEAPLREQATRLGIGAQLHLLGLRDDIPDLLAAADLFIHPSLSEGLPMAILEAMFARKAVIASAVGEIPAVLAQGAAGVVVPPGDSEALAEAILRLATDPGRRSRLGEEAGRRAASAYSLEQMVQSYLDLYQHP